MGAGEGGKVSLQQNGSEEMETKNNKRKKWIGCLTIVLLLAVVAVVAVVYYGRHVAMQMNAAAAACCGSAPPENVQYRVAADAGPARFREYDGNAGSKFSAEKFSEVAECRASSHVGPAMPSTERETPGSERYAEFKENEFMETAVNPLSTFSIDVDTASYTMARRFLMDMKRLPARDSIRLEEFVNYFDYGYADPTGSVPVAVHCEMAGCPWKKMHRLLRVGVQAKRMDSGKLPPNNLTFLIDVSGSMNGENCLPLLVKSMKLMVDQMRDEDYVSIVTYANGVDVRLSPTSGRNKGRIHSVLDGLRAYGGTSGGEGLRVAYEEAKRNFRKDGNNRVILATDGDFNLGLQSDAELVRFIEQKRDDGIFLTVLGFGMGNYQDARMKKIADAGNGHYAYIDGLLEAKKVLMTEFAGTLFTVAKDVKIQIEFNPSHVQSYRLLGYESRLLKAKDFNDDKKDAGEMGAGHSVTALYEIVPPGAASDVPKTDALKYQKSVAVDSAEVLTVKLRYKDPKGEKSTLIEQPLTGEALTKAEPSADFRFAASVAEVALLLRDSAMKGDASYDAAIERARKSKGEDLNGYRAEFIRLAEAAQLYSR